MKLFKRIGALVLSLMILLTMVAATGVTVSATVGGGKAGTGTIQAWGCDMSFYNVSGSSGLDYSLVDFAKMKADGCEYVILRIGYEGSATRTNAMDKAFLELYNMARAADMDIGVYFYALATTYEGAKEDAEWCISIFEQYDMYFEYPIYYDVEDPGNGADRAGHEALSSAETTNLCLGWAETLEAAGYFPGMYAGYYVINDLTSAYTDNYDVWYAAVATNGPGTQYDPNTRTQYSTLYGMWQYKWYNTSASVPSYDGAYAKDSKGYMLDCNVSYKDYPTIIASGGYNNMGDTAEKIGTYQVTASSLNVRSGPSTDYGIVGSLQSGDCVVVTEMSNGWGKLVTPDGVEGWASITDYGDYIGVDALGYEKREETGGISYVVNKDGSITITNSSTTDQGLMDFYLPLPIGTSTTPYFSVQIVPLSGSGYYFGLTQAGTGYWMMRDCMSGDQLVNETSAPYMTNMETLQINVDEWWNPTEDYHIDVVRFYLAPSTSIRINYMYFAEETGTVTDTRYNTLAAASNVTLMRPDTLDIVDRNKTGSYEYNNGMLKVISGSAEGYEVVFNVNQEFKPEELTRLLIDVDAGVPFDIELLCETSDGERTFSLRDDFWPEFTGQVAPEGDYIPAVTRTAGLDLLNCFVYNNVLPADGISTIKKVTVRVSGEGTVYINAIQIAENDRLINFYDGVTKSDSSAKTDTPDPTPDPEPVVFLKSDVYVVADNIINRVQPGTTVLSFYDNVTSDYVVTVYENDVVVSSSEMAKTGQFVRVWNENTVVATYTIVVTGDVNGDGKMNTTDVRTLLVSLVDQPLVGSQLLAADLNGTGTVDSSTAKDMLMAVLNA